MAGISIDGGAAQEFEAFAGNAGVEENAAADGFCVRKTSKRPAIRTKLRLGMGGPGDCFGQAGGDGFTDTLQCGGEDIFFVPEVEVEAAGGAGGSWTFIGTVVAWSP
jgi:hypothetical protein